MATNFVSIVSGRHIRFLYVLYFSHKHCLELPKGLSMGVVEKLETNMVTWALMDSNYFLTMVVFFITFYELVIDIIICHDLSKVL